MPQPTFLAIQRPYFVLGYPFLMERLRPRLKEMGELREGTLPRNSPISSAFDLGAVDCLFYSGGRLTDACVAAAPRLKAVATYTDNTGEGLPAAALAERGIPVIDYKGWIVIEQNSSFRPARIGAAESFHYVRDVLGLGKR